MATKRKDGRWQTILRRPAQSGQKTTALYFYGSTSEEAEQRKAEFLADTDGADAGDTRTVDGYIRYVWAPTVETRTVKTKETYEWALSHILPAFGHLDLEDVTRTHVQLWVNGLARNLAAKSVKDIFSLLKGIFQLAFDLGRVERTPCLRIALPEIPPTSATILSLQESMDLFNAAQGTVAWRPIYVASTLGLRKGEACAIRYSGIRNGVLKVEKQMQRQKGHGVVEKAPKMHQVRAIPLPEDVAKQFKEFRTSSDFICPNSIGAFLDPENINPPMRTALKACGLPQVTFHSLRKSACTNLVSLGTPLPVVMRIFGWTQIETLLEVYNQVRDDQVRDAMDRLQKMLMTVE